MSKSYQHEIPKARVNITLELETGGAKKKKELPLKLLALGDYSHGKTQGSVAERERININKNNFNKVLADLSPELHFTVANRIHNDNSDFRVDLQIQHMNDFHPENIVHAIPSLRNLLAMRHILKDLKSNLLDNHKLRKELEKIVKDQDKVLQLQSEMRLLGGNSASQNQDEE